MAESVYVGKEGAQELYRKVKGDIGSARSAVEGELEEAVTGISGELATKATKTELAEAVELIDTTMATKAELAEEVGEINDALAGKSDIGHTHVKEDITDFAHTHVKEDITDFAHTHAKADITDFAHTHVKEDITDFAHTHVKADITDFEHNHDDLYYTKAVIDTSLATKENVANKVDVIPLEETGDEYPSLTLLKSEIAHIQELIGELGGFAVVTLTDKEPKVPDVQDPSEKIIYLTKEAGSSKTDPYTEWICTSTDPAVWEVIGETSIDLTDYYTKTQVDTLLSVKANAAEMSVVAGTGSDADKTTITLKNNTSATVLTAHQDISGKVDAVPGKGLSTYDYDDAERSIVHKVWASDNFPIIPVVPPSPGTDTITIAGREYPTVQIGNRIWLAENLCYPLTSFGTSYTASCWANFDSTNANKYGMLYWIRGIQNTGGDSSDAPEFRAELLRIIPEGWRIANYDDFNALYTNYTPAELLSDVYNPEYNSTGFSARLAGVSAFDWDYAVNVGTQIHFMLDTISGEYTTFYLERNTKAFFGQSKVQRVSIRLVKDAT